MKKQTKKLKKELKKVNLATLIFVVVFAVIGAVSGYGVCMLLTKNDVFELNGDTEMTIDVGTPYNELGAKAIAFGKDISSEVVVEGTVNVDVAGRYVIKYKVGNIRFMNHVLYRLVIVEEVTG